MLQHMPVEEMARKYPSYGYQVYLASEASTIEIETNVCSILIYFILHLWRICSKLVSFLQLLFTRPEKALPYAKPGELRGLITNKQIDLTDSCLLNEHVMPTNCDFLMLITILCIIGPAILCFFVQTRHAGALILLQNYKNTVWRREEYVVHQLHSYCSDYKSQVVCFLHIYHQTFPFFSYTELKMPRAPRRQSGTHTSSFHTWIPLPSRTSVIG